MPKVTRAPAEKPPARRRQAPTAVLPRSEEAEVRVSSVVFGIIIIAALIVASAAWMGGSLHQVRSHVDNSMDGVARGLGLSVEQVAVVGVEGDLARIVRDAAMVEPGENMFRADPHVIRRRVESTRQVLGVQVHRLWPDQILVIAAPAKPLALWRNQDEWAVVDSFGRLMPGVDAAMHADLVKVVGLGAAEASPELASALVDAADLKTRIVYAERVSQRRWDVHFDNGLVAKMPGGDDLARAVHHLDQLHADQGVIDRDVAILDLRSEGRVFVAPKQNEARALAMISGAT